MSKTTKIILVAAVLFGVTVLAIGLLAGKQGFDQRDEGLRQSTGAATENKQSAEQLCAQVEALGKKCAVDTEDLKSGAQSIKGVPGVQGIPGVPGGQGPQGVAGQPGDEGAIGATGATGPRGARGPVGATGATGAAGATGQPGVQGQQGERGPQGGAGETGARGPQGNGIKSVTCTGALPGTTFGFTYDDGTTQTVACE